MGKRGKKAAGFWMMQRHEAANEAYNPDNPHGFPEYVLGATFGAILFSGTFFLNL